MNYGSFKLTWVVPTPNTSTKNVANIFPGHWTILFGIVSNVLTNSGPKFVRILLTTFYVYLKIMPITAIAYHPQTNAQVRWYNKTIFTRLIYCNCRRAVKSGSPVQPLNYAYNAHVHRTTNTSPYSLVLNRLQPGPTLLRTEYENVSSYTAGMLIITKARHDSSTHPYASNQNGYPIAGVPRKL